MTRSWSDLRIASDHLKSLPSHNAIILMRSSFSAPKIMHTLPCASCSAHPLLYEFDNLLREGIRTITKSLLPDLQRLQTSLPIAPDKPSNQRGRPGHSSCFIAGSFRLFSICCEHAVSPGPSLAIGHIVP